MAKSGIDTYEGVIITGLDENATAKK